MILYTTVPVISYQYISYSTLSGKSNGYVDTTLIGERLANWKVILVEARAKHVLE